MQDPVHEIRSVISSITEPREAAVILANVDKYFTATASIIHPMFNSPKQAGREGLKAAYKMLRVLTINNKMEYHVVAFDNVVVRSVGETRAAPHQNRPDVTLSLCPGLARAWSTALGLSIAPSICSCVEHPFPRR